MPKLEPNFAELLNGIPAGAWVAISQHAHETIAYGDDARVVLNEARGKGERFPLMLRVPESKTAAL
jgi:hypothetical protein